MILYFYDRFFNPLGKAASNLPKGIYYTDDKQVDDVESGTSTFEFYLEFDSETRNLTKTYADESFYIVAKDEDEETRVWQIIDDESDEEAMTRYFYCEDAGMDLINETLPAWPAPSTAQKVAYYINKAIYDSGFEIGNNEIPSLTRTLDWDGEATALARLQSILTQFDNAEFRFRFVIDENTLELQHKYIDIYQKVGAETGVQLRYGREVKNIKVKRSRANLVNAYRCYGATPSGKNAPINLTGYTLSASQKEINADTGKARFVLSGNILKDTESNAKYSRYLNPSEQGEDLGYYTGIYQGTAQTQKGLADEVIRKLKQTGEIEVNYEVELVDAPRTLSIGDYVYVINDADELYLEGRILKLERSRSNDTFDITLGDYLIQSSGISNQLQALADQIASLNASKNYNYTISTTNGWSFKNSEGSTTLSAIIRDNIVDVTDVFAIEWYKDGVKVATSATLVVNASDISGKAVYKYLAKNDDGETVGQAEITVVNVDDGKFGDLTDDEKKEIASHGEQFLAYAQGLAGEDFSLTPLQELAKYVGTAAYPYTDYTKYVWNLNPEWLQQESNNNLANKVDNDTYNNDQSTVWQEISNRVTEEEAQAIQDSLTNVTNAYTDFVSTGGKHDQDLANLKSAINTDIQKLADKVLGYDFVNTWFRIGDGGLSIGEANSNFEILISNDQITFYDSGTAVAYVSNQSFFINSGMIVDDLQIGKFKFAKVNDNLMGLFHIA